MSVKKVLFVTTVDLMLESGGTRYSKSVLNALPSQYSVHLMVLAHCQRINHRGLRWLLAAIKSLFTGIPPNVLFHSGMLRNESCALLKEHWDIIFIDHLESLYVLNQSAGRNFVYVSHNRESELIDQKLPRAPHWIKRPLENWIESCEIELSALAGGVISISSLEAEWYRQFSKNVSVIYPVFNLENKPVTHIEGTGVLRVGFLGSGAWRPNKEAVETLIHDILPLTKRRIEFVLAGGAWDREGIITSVSRSAISQNVSATVWGYVSDIGAFWSSIDVFVAPIVSGAGVNVKICESLANGVPVVALPHAVRGMTENILRCGGVILAQSSIEFSEYLEAFKVGEKVFSPPSEFTPNFAEQCLTKIVEVAVRNAPSK